MQETEDQPVAEDETTEESSETAAEQPAKQRSPMAGPGRPARHPSFPRPPRKKCSPDQFFSFWRRLTKPHLDRTTVYVYAYYPVLNYYALLSLEEMADARAGRRPKPETNIDKLVDPFPDEDWESEILHRWGSGNYHFKLNDSETVTKDKWGKDGHTVCTCDVKLDRPDYLPIRDYRLIDMNSKENQTFIQRARVAGVRLPGDDLAEFEKREDDEMAQVQVIDKLTDALISERKQQPAPVPPPQPTGQAEAAQVVAQGASEAIKLMAQANAQANAAAVKAADPGETVKLLKEVAEMLKPAPVPAADNKQFDMMMEMMRTQSAASLAQSAALEKRLEAAEKRNADLMTLMLTRNDTAQKEEKPKSLTAQLRELGEARELIRDIAGTGDGGEAEPINQWAEFGLNAFDKLGAHVNTFMANLAVMKTGQGNPQHPVVDATRAEPQQPIPVKQLSPEEQMIEELKAPLVTALANGQPGYEFAAAIIDHFRGDTEYTFIHKFGPRGVQMLMQSNGELWSATRPYASRLDQFIDEFLDIEQVKLAVQRHQSAQRNVVKPNGQGQPQGAGRVVYGSDGKPIQTKHTPPDVV